MNMEYDANNFQRRNSLTFMEWREPSNEDVAEMRVKNTYRDGKPQKPKPGDKYILIGAIVGMIIGGVLGYSVNLFVCIIGIIAGGIIGALAGDLIKKR